MDDLKYLALLHNLGFTHKKLHDIFTMNQNYREVYETLSQETLKSYGFSQKQIDFISERRKKITINYIEGKLKKYGANIVSYPERRYPEMLRNIPNPPFLLYIQGKIGNSPKFSVVGSRIITSYGEKCIDYLVPDIGRYFTIVSGGALGCDTQAHLKALEHKIKTIVVIGTGLDECYPVQNSKIYKDILSSGGAILSIFPFGEPANRRNFPVRNEIVAGLSVGALVVEAKEKSGSLITARLCLELGRDVFACPGEIFKQNSRGTNSLILAGTAKPVTSPKDVLSEYNISVGIVDSSKRKDEPNFSDQLEKQIYELLILESLSVDELLIKTSLDIKTLTLKLSLLEISGLISKASAGKYGLN